MFSTNIPILYWTQEYNMTMKDMAPDLMEFTD